MISARSGVRLQGIAAGIESKVDSTRKNGVNK
jgi:hypothetical protein